MRLAVYLPDRGSYPYVLTPDCLQPSRVCESQYGHMHLRGVVSLDENLLPALAHSLSPETDFEYVIYSGYGMWAIETLLARQGIQTDKASVQ